MGDDDDDVVVVGDADGVLFLFKLGGMEMSGSPRLCRTSLYVGVRAERGGLTPTAFSSSEEDAMFVVFKDGNASCDDGDDVADTTGGSGGNAKVACLAVAGSEPCPDEVGEGDVLCDDLEDDLDSLELCGDDGSIYGNVGGCGFVDGGVIDMVGAADCFTVLSALLARSTGD